MSEVPSNPNRTARGAREIAAEKHAASYPFKDDRARLRCIQNFKAGWDAAIGYATHKDWVNPPSKE